MPRTKCDNCHYYQKAGNDRYCAYLLMTDKRRPCDPGEACTVKVPRAVKRRKKTP